jgi:hypothetical protein
VCRVKGDRSEEKTKKSLRPPVDSKCLLNADPFVSCEVSQPEMDVADSLSLLRVLWSTQGHPRTGWTGRLKKECQVQKQHC